VSFGEVAQPRRVDSACASLPPFNKRAAEELRERLDQALELLGVEPGAVRVRTFHALGREILRDAGESVEPLVDRMALVDRLFAIMPPAERRRLDTAFSRFKLDLCVTADQVAADPAAGPIARAFVAYERQIAAEGGLDFDDLIVRALAVLEREAAVLSRWHARAAHLLVDEVQDVDRSQLHLALLVAAPENRIFLVGDDDQPSFTARTYGLRHDWSHGRNKEGSPLQRPSDPTGTPNLRALAFPGMRSAEARGHHGTCRQVR